MEKHNFEESNSPSFSNIYTEEIKKKEKKIFKSIFSKIALIMVCFVIGAGGSTVYEVVNDVLIPMYAQDSIVKKATPINTKSVIKNQNDIVKYAIGKVSPSVVSITTLTDTSFLNIPTTYSGIGSGIIFYQSATDTFIVTNYHVIDKATKVGVAIDDYPPVLAKFVAKDVNSDLGIISVKNNRLKEMGIKDVRVATFDKESETKVGDYVIAIGNAVGEGITSTFGIISSTSKDIITNKHNSLEGVMQTTAAINPGNSGGALINLKGEIIGINTTKEANNLVEGMGYTINSKVAMPIIEQIMNNTRPASLGVTVTDTANIAGDINLPGGALVMEVIKGSAAEKYGIKPKDIITSINNVPILSTAKLLDEIKKYSVSDTIELKVFRDGKVKTIEVKLIQNPSKSTSF